MTGFDRTTRQGLGWRAALGRLGASLSGSSAITRGDGFAAGGSQPRADDIFEPSQRRRLQLICEIAVVFVLAPLLMRYAVFHHEVPLFYALPPVLIAMSIFLLADPTFDFGREMRRGFSVATLLSIVTLFAVGALFVAAFVAIVLPELLFALAAERPGKWAKIMMLYPFTSVLAQEFVYRVFFFHRYGPLFSSKTSLIVVNAAVFALGHILFRNWIAVGGTFIVGLLLAWRYERTRSFWAVWFEHVLWGWLVFTIGLGVFFFTGIRNPAW